MLCSWPDVHDPSADRVNVCVEIGERFCHAGACLADPASAHAGEYRQPGAE